MKVKYKVIKNFFSKEICQFVSGYLLLKRNQTKFYKEVKYISPYDTDYGGWEDPQAMGSYSLYGDLATETLLQLAKFKIEKISKTKLYPTYSYCRIYEKGSFLKEHIDRDECSVSATLFLGGDKWPIFLLKNNKKIKIDLNYGDLLLYKGNEIPHYRNTFLGNTCIQVFLHYADKEELKYDKRPHLGTSLFFSGYGK